ncbi:glutamate ABC transporter substrate-binding protein [Kineococcus sp. NUM-3379]
MRTRLLPTLAAAALSTLALGACGQEGAPTPGAAPGETKAAAPTYAVAEGVALSGSPTFDKAKSRGKLVVGIKYDQPGIGLKNAATGGFEGFDVEIAKKVAADLGFAADAIEFKESVSANREPFLQNGQVDMVVATYTINDKRKQVVDFAGPYYVAGQDLLVRKDETAITGPDTLAGKKVCSVDGSTPAGRIQEKYPDAQLVTFDTYSKCVEQLTSKQVDAVTTDDAILRGFAAQQPDALKVLGTPFSEEPYGIGLPKDDKVLRDAVNDSLEESVEDGTWKKIFDATLGGVGAAPEPPSVDRY